MKTVLEARRLTVRHPRADRDAVRDVTLALRQGEVLAVVGPNGSGKSTLLSALGGDLPPRSGQALLHGRDLFRMRPRERARLLARVPQDPRAPEGLTVEELVAMGRYAHRGAFAGLAREDRDALDAALRTVDAGELRRRPIERISGGERRRVWLAVALAQRTPLLLLDEPTANLDLRHQVELMEHLRSINRRHATTILVALHELDRAAALAHRVAVMANGRLYAAGPPEKVLTEDTLRDVFGVRATIERSRGFHVQVHGSESPVRRI